ncbi:MAG: hypothetical protein QGH39_06400 [Candidatus Thermoplasmatota archaeon]|jgi:sulfur carrier protein ThiS|nr:hypothetical protein [Candidatus Thermoplasmatota archaeon]MDP7265174.1 hypothetical protein [Candidatus Thermoplasmatota archaeon]
MEITVIKKTGRDFSQTLDLPPHSTPMDLMEKFGMFVDITICLRNSKIIPCDQELADGDQITLLNVASGG